MLAVFECSEYFFLSGYKPASVNICRIMEEDLFGSGTTVKNEPFCFYTIIIPFSPSVYIQEMQGY